MSLFCLKRFVIAFISAFHSAPVAIPIFAYTMFSLFSIGYTKNNKPFLRKANNMIEIINESFIFTTGYFLMLFSEWIYNPQVAKNGEYVHDPVTIYNYGYVYITILFLILGLNLSYVLIEFKRSFQKAYRKSRE